ncbi:MAG TPA: signal peptidase I [Symbiobacteriaceae bacterium]|jgi:signal peptidase I|nr:signal peptidase I [Symbiobacteriaceae bacterium]
MKLLRGGAKLLAATAVSLFFMGVASCLAVMVSAGLSRDGLPTFFGHKVFTVQGWSMEPAIRNGDLILVRPLAEGQYASEGDIITFRPQKQPDAYVTHRVIGVIIFNGKPGWYVTKGDANQSADMGTVAVTSAVGRYEGRIPYAAFVIRFMQRPVGMIALIIAPGLLLLAWIVAGAFRTLRGASGSRKESAEAGEGGGALSP